MNTRYGRIVILLFIVLAVGCGHTESHDKFEQALPEGGVLINDRKDDYDSLSNEHLYQNRFSYISPEGKKETVGESSCVDSNPDVIPEVIVAAKVIILNLRCDGPDFFIRSEEGTWARYTLNTTFLNKYLQEVNDQTPSDKNISGSISLIGIDRDKAEITIEYSAVVNRRMIFKVTDKGKRLVMTSFKSYPNPVYDLDSLKKQLNDKKGNYRAGAAISLGVLADTQAVDTLIGALSDKDYTVRATAAQALGTIGDPRAVEPLIAILTTSKGVLAENAAMALGRIREKKAVEPLIKVLLDKSHCPLLSVLKEQFLMNNGREDYLRSSAAYALGEIGDSRAIEPLTSVLKTSVNERWYVRREAATALGMINDPRSVEALVSSVNVFNKDLRGTVLFELKKVTDKDLRDDMKGKKPKRAE